MAGNHEEPWIRANYQYFDWNVKFDHGDHLKERRELNIKQRKVIDPRHSFSLKAKPHIKVNVDGVITNCDTYPGIGILECKTRKSQSMRELSNGVSEADYLQLQHGIYVMGADYGVMGYLIDGCDWQFVPFTADAQLQQMLVQVYDHFWSKIEKARKIKADNKITRYTGPDRTKDIKPNILAQLKELEPRPTSKSLEVVKSNVDKSEEVKKMPGTPEMFDIITAFDQVNKRVKEEEESKKSLYAQVLRLMDDAKVLQFDDGSTAKLTVNKHGTVSLRIKVADD